MKKNEKMQEFVKEVENKGKEENDVENEEKD